MSDIQELRDQYETLLRAYSAASRKTEEALGEVRPIGPEGVQLISQAWVVAVGELHAIEPEYIATRDAYWNAVQQRG